ncbi:MAG: branched-chain amino acid ABC transporter permease [Acidobacteriia bacterium]|nr:branched-chain amino acid ABC transporter permease [Methyloceanibacter sp.]MBX5471612.1 branched-chain amino acid ABC transporter permease [Acetobacteraceae bacterium]MCL6492425.1 branched-chain amino acid ABC transporter permease [Terriglobia bacterium]
MSPALILQVAIGGILMGLLYAVVAAGLTLIFGLMNVVNFAHGALLMAAMYATWLIHRSTGLDPLLQLPLVAALLFGTGVAIYRVLIARTLQIRVNGAMVQIFTTFGLSIFLVGLAQLVFGSDFQSINASFLGGRTLAFGAVVLPLPLVASGVVSLLVFLALFRLSRTEFGRALEATREDFEAVALIGVDRDRIFGIGWGIGAAAVGIAGVLLANFYYISPDVGTNFALIAYVAVALGGFGSILGALIAGLVIGLTEALTALVVDPSLKQIGIFLIYLAVLMFRPRGLFGKL